MARNRVTVAQLAREAALDLDEALITLWDAGFDDVAGPDDFISKGEANRARRLLGLATRRELASPTHWQNVFKVEPEEFTRILMGLGVNDPMRGAHLRSKTIHRLRSEFRRRGLMRKVTADHTAAPHEGQGDLPFEWGNVGHERDMRFLSIEEVKRIHEALVFDFARSDDPISPAGVRSEDLLASAVHRPSTSIGETQKYPTVQMAAAALLHALVHDHAFHNGNKRTALVAMLVFLDENGIVLTCNEDQLFKLVLQLAQHALVQGPREQVPDREVLSVARWIKDNSRLMEKGDRAIPWRRFQQILTSYGCTFESARGVGHRMNIERTVIELTRFFRLPRKVVLRTQVAFGSNGREVSQNTLNKSRRDLYLDDAHGVDSRAFYEGDDASASEFIVRYRKTLNRLARL